MAPSETYRELVAPSGVFKPTNPYSPALRIGELLLISGHVACTEDGTTVGVGDVGAQTRAIFEALGRILGAAGGTFSDLVELKYYLTDMGDFGVVNEVRKEFLTDAPYPTSTAVEVSRLANDAYLLEISGTAAIRR